MVACFVPANPLPSLIIQVKNISSVAMAGLHKIHQDPLRFRKQTGDLQTGLICMVPKAGSAIKISLPLKVANVRQSATLDTDIGIHKVLLGQDNSPMPMFG